MTQAHTHEHERENTHAHTHASTRAAAPAGREQRLAPSGHATVLLDIGAGVGALVVHAPQEWNGVEIELARNGETHAFTHTEVRERVLPEGSVYAGVFPALVEGDYTMVGVEVRPSQRVAITSGRVTEVELVPRP